MTLIRLFLVGMIAFALNPSGAAVAQSYPIKPITLIVPYSPGGAMDVFARLVADVAGDQLGQHVIVENRAGAGGVIGTKSVLRAAPDGYTLLWGTSGTLAIAAALYKGVNYDPTSLVPVALVARLPHVLVVHPSVPAQSVADLVQDIKANPGKFSFGASLGTPPQLLGALFVQQAGLDAVFIPEKGGANATLDLLAGRTQFSFDSMTVNYPLIVEGKVRPLAMADETRWPLLPDLPTMAESGFPQFALSAYCGVFAPTQTPPDIVNKLNNAINAGLAGNDAKARLAQFNAFAQPGTPDEFAAYISRMNSAWGDLVERSGITKSAIP
jgi:tripartite-type tricarboxylate transporter receptor subunit TctC